MSWFQRLLDSLLGRGKAPAEKPPAPIPPPTDAEAAPAGREPPSPAPELEPVSSPPVAARAIDQEPASGPISPPAPAERPTQGTTPAAVEPSPAVTSPLLYLGPGVSARLNQHVGDLERLRQSGLPAMPTPADLAEALGLSMSRLRWLAYHNELATRVHYVRFEVPKRGGGSRTLMAPHRELARAQRWIFETILSRLTPHDAAHGFVRGRGTLSNASAHCGRSILINLDLKDFFPSVGFPRVRSVFQHAGYSPAVATVLALLCTECPRTQVRRDGVTYHAACGPRGLPQGACTSPGLSNLVALRLDRRLTGLARTMDATYTRYADDMTFSGGPNLADAVPAFLSRVGHVVRAEGFTLHPDKTRVLRRSTAQTITGLVVNDRPKLRRSDIRRLRAILHRARHEGLEAQNRANHPNFRAWLMGTIAYVGMSDPQLARSFRAQFEALEDAPRS